MRGHSRALVVVAATLAVVFVGGLAITEARLVQGGYSVVILYPGLLLAMAAGLFGATFSMLMQTQRRTSSGTLDDVEAAASWHTLLVRCSFGVGAAAILYFFFRSGLLEGSLWPKLTDLKFEAFTQGTEQRIPNRDWCLLVIWSFVAGFSENFVPTILVKTEEKGQAGKAGVT